MAMFFCLFLSFLLYFPLYLESVSNAFSWMKMIRFRFKFHWSLFPWVQLTINQHWFREWLDAKQVISHCLNQWWPSSWSIYVPLGGDEFKKCRLNPHYKPKTVWWLPQVYNGAAYTNKTVFSSWIRVQSQKTGLILGLRPANERRRYKVTSFLIGWAQT